MNADLASGHRRLDQRSSTPPGFKMASFVSAGSGAAAPEVWPVVIRAAAPVFDPSTPRGGRKCGTSRQLRHLLAAHDRLVWLLSHQPAVADRSGRGYQLWRTPWQRLQFAPAVRCFVRCCHLAAMIVLFQARRPRGSEESPVLRILAASTEPLRCGHADPCRRDALLVSLEFIQRHVLRL